MSLGLDNLSAPYVYRVLRPDEDPNEDIRCKAPHSNRSISEHIETGLRIPSKFISTTSSLESARKWLQTSDEKTSSRYKNRRTTIIRIDVDLLKQRYPRIADSAIDLTTRYNRDIFLEDEKQMRFAGAYKEVLFVGRIPSEAVSIEYKRGQSIVRKELSAHTPYLHSPTASGVMHNPTSPVGINNQLGAQYNAGNTTSAAVSLGEKLRLASYPNLMYNYSNDNETRNSVSNSAQIQTTQPSFLYSSNATSLQQTRGVQFSPQYYGGNTTSAAVSLREKQRLDTYRNSLYDYSDYNETRDSASNFNPTSYHLSRCSNNTTSLQQTHNVHSGAGSYQCSYKAQSPYSNMTDNLATRCAPWKTPNSESNSLSSRYPIRNEVPPINRSLPTRDNSTANTSIWRKILSFFNLV